MQASSRCYPGRLARASHPARRPLTAPSSCHKAEMTLRSGRDGSAMRPTSWHDKAEIVVRSNPHRTTISALSCIFARYAPTRGPQAHIMLTMAGLYAHGLTRGRENAILQEVCFDKVSKPHLPHIPLFAPPYTHHATTGSPAAARRGMVRCAWQASGGDAPR